MLSEYASLTDKVCSYDSSSPLSGTLRVFRFLLERWSHDEFIERWESENIPNCAVTSYVFDRAAQRLLLRALNVVHW
jgi:hypothetical protein